MTAPTDELLPTGALQFLSPDGVLIQGQTSPLGDQQLQHAYWWMTFSRRMDAKFLALQRQGALASYGEHRGQEASFIGPTLALTEDDWIVPAYRDIPSLVLHGWPLSRHFAYLAGNQLGSGPGPTARALPTQIALAAQLPQAVGLAWGLAHMGRDEVVLAFCGDGATSEGDFHEACNLAGVLKAPVVFVVQNNGWAISMPRQRQSAASSLAARAEGYGMPGVVADGNDVFATYAATREAVERARSGAGPTLIENITYRMGGHATSDDPKRYTDAGEVERWAAADPLRRLDAFLTERGLVDDEARAAITAEVDGEIAQAWEEAQAIAAPDGETLFDNLYSELPERLKRQREHLLAFHANQG